jgi:cobalt/nickel transport protein
MTIGQRNLLLLLVAVLIAGIPALMALGVLPSLVPDAPWSGGDTQITETVASIQEDYEPWFEAIFSPADMGIEPLLFGIQAFIGAALIAGFLGWLIGRRHGQTGVEGNERRTAMIVSAIGLVIFFALFLVQTDLGELQAFIAAIQAICLGTLAFFIGYPLGRRMGSSAGAKARAAAAGASPNV